MCGKFTQRRIAVEAWTEFHDLADAGDAENIEGWLTGAAEPDGLTPMRFAMVTRKGVHGRAETVPMRWGVSALSAENPSKPDHIHARCETIDEKPTFRDAFRERRGLLLVHSFNEGEEVSPTKTVQHIITPRDGKMLAIAVLWEAWRHTALGELLTFTMVTTPANALIGAITDRMPAVLDPKDYAAWLGLAPATQAELKAMLKPHDGASWDMTPEKKTPPPKKPKVASTQGELF
ncbi:MAG TPA: SOS response-associated peptidase family protein [Rhizomicrobium sp.]|jgi:putative SOS response-associated peptidase YedK